MELFHYVNFNVNIINLDPNQRCVPRNILVTRLRHLQALFLLLLCRNVLYSLSCDFNVNQNHIIFLIIFSLTGDVHGQYADLLKIFSHGGFPPESNYLFLGDYVDRGKNSLETICLLLAYKIKYPENFFLLRGNHECASVCRIYGFFDECMYSSLIFFHSITWKHR